MNLKFKKKNRKKLIMKTILILNFIPASEHPIIKAAKKRLKD